MPGVEQVLARFAFAEEHLGFDGFQPDEDLADHEKGHAAVEQDDAGPLLEQGLATGEQHEAGDRSLHELVEDSHRGIALPEFDAGEEQPGKRARERCRGAERHPAFDLVLDARLETEPEAAGGERQHSKQEDIPQLAVADEGHCLQAVVVIAAGDDEPGDEHSHRQKPQARNQPGAAGLDPEADEVGGEEVQQHQPADDPALGKDDRRPLRERRGGDEFVELSCFAFDDFVGPADVEEPAGPLRGDDGAQDRSLRSLELERLGRGLTDLQFARFRQQAECLIGQQPDLGSPLSGAIAQGFLGNPDAGVGRRSFGAAGEFVTGFFAVIGGDALPVGGNRGAELIGGAAGEEGVRSEDAERDADEEGLRHVADGAGELVLLDAEVLVDHVPDVGVHLGESAGEDDDDRHREQHDGEFQRRQRPEHAGERVGSGAAIIGGGQRVGHVLIG